jgi:hypothetical protein
MPATPMTIDERLTAISAHGRAVNDQLRETFTAAAPRVQRRTN